MLELTPNQIQIEINNLGYDMFPRKQKNGMYKIEVWLGDEKCFGLGKIEYQCWHEGVKKTYEDFYKKLILNVKYKMSKNYGERKNTIKKRV